MKAIPQVYKNNTERAAPLWHALHAHSRGDMLLIGGISVGTSNPATGRLDNALHMLSVAWSCTRRTEGVDDEE